MNFLNYVDEDIMYFDYEATASQKEDTKFYEDNLVKEWASEESDCSSYEWM